MSALTVSASRRINTSPTTSVLQLRVDDVDCTDTSFAYPPEDGQFVLVGGTNGKTATAGLDAAPSTADYALTSKQYCSETKADLTDKGAGLAMVWSSAQHVDRQALGDKRVPVIRGEARFKTKLFNVPDDTVALSHANNGYVVGGPVTVKMAKSSIQGTAARLVIGPLSLKNGSSYGKKAGTDVGVWAVGYLVRIVTDSVIAGKGELEIQLYDSPRFIPLSA